MMQTVGRLLVREGKISGIFLPIGGNLQAGLYDVQEIMGEIQIRYVGKPVLAEGTLNGLDLNGLMDFRPESFMTPYEYALAKD